MTVVERLVEAGGLSTRAALLAHCDRIDIDKALAAGEIVAVGRGRYALPIVDEGSRKAHALSGLLSLTSAALHHGWEVKTAPDLPHVVVPRKRRVSSVRRTGVHLHRFDTHEDDIADIATGIDLTLAQCLTQLPFDEALAVADSALRHDVLPARLHRVVKSLRGPGSVQARRVAQLATPDSANPFESVLKAIAADVEGLNAKPQVRIRTAKSTARPDLVDADLKVVLEADSFEWHGDRAALRRDAQRYNLLVVEGWLVLRFAWEDVMFDPGYVSQVLVAVVALVQRQAERPCSRCRAA